MPSPFPGMDPYLESAAYWRGVHSRFINDLADELNCTLPMGYAADIDERLYLVESDRSLFPDLLVSREAPTPVGVGIRSATLSTAVNAPWQVPIPFPEEITEAFIEIQQIRPERRVVTVIEVLSPSNKTLGSEGRDSYLQKQHEVHEQEISLLELDLLRGDAHTVAAPLSALQRFGTWDYLACLHRAGRREWEVWPIRLREPLPEIYVPLLNGDGDLSLSLQPILERVYQRGRYSLRVNYREELKPPLKPEDAKWAQELLRPLLEEGEATGFLESET